MISVDGKTLLHYSAEDFPPPPESWEEPRYVRSRGEWVTSRFVSGEGPEGASILILGEAPGYWENKYGRPFIGPAGKLLNNFLQNAGISREDCYVTNVIKYQPPGNKINTHDAIDQVQKNTKALISEIRRVKPKVIVPTGNTALQALGFNYKIGKSRGSIIDSPFGKIIPTYHPASLFRQWHETFTVQKDWIKIARHASKLGVPQWKENFLIKPTIEDVEELSMFLNNLVNSGIKVSVAIDLETYKVDNPLITPIKTVGIAQNETTATVIPFITQSDQYYWDNETRALRAIQAIANILENPNIEKVFHNALFDVLVLMNHGFTIEGPIFDTMLGQYLVYHLSPHDLGYVVSVYTDYPPWKLTEGHGDIEFRKYNARDCVVLNIIKPELESDINDNNVRVVFDILMKQIVPTVKMMLNGIYLDKNRYENVKEMLESHLEEIRQRISEIAGFQINLESNRHMRNLLFKQLKLRSDVKTKGGQKSTGKDVLNRLSLRYPDLKVLDDIQEYRTLSTRYKTFIKNVQVLEDGRVHSNFKLHIVVTGRYSSTNPNIMNLPSRADPDGYIRKMYTAAPGNKIVAADYSQIELMIFAEIARDELWMQAFREGKDVHVINAEGLLGFYDEKYRTFVKNFIYGFIYGSEGGDIAKVAPKELIQRMSIETMMNNLKMTHPALFSYRENIENQIKTQRYITNAFGRRRWYVDKISKEDIRSAYNYPIQATAGDIMHIKMPEIDQELNWPKEKLILQLHDAFYLEVPERNVDRAAQLLKTIMEEPVYSPMGYEFNLKAKVEVGDSLSSKEMEEWNGPRTE